MSQEARCLEDLQQYKRDKTFLDLLAISEGKKKVKSSKIGHSNQQNTFLTSVANQK